jgi:diaminopimelate epimerase
MRFDYLKMHGTGNRILVVDARGRNAPPPPPDTLRALANAVTGPGFDQLLWVTDAQGAGGLAAYRVFNADGSEVEQCGNGARCLAHALGSEPGAPRAFTLESPAGPVSATILDSGDVSISMGVPITDPRRVPFVADEERLLYPLTVDGRRYDVAVVSMGNPHCVIDLDDAASAPVAEIGPLIEHHERFPERVNVGFMQVVDRGNIVLRVHERGVGETLACGTGACAAVVCGRRRDLLDETVGVRLPGGQVMVSWRGAGETVWLTGSAELISEGTVDL